MAKVYFISRRDAGVDSDFQARADPGGRDIRADELKRLVPTK
jgi:hypothetical protein